MRIRINSDQLNLLIDGFTIIEGYGLIENEKNLIQESRMPEYLVAMIVQGQPMAIRISGYTQGSVLRIARTLFKNVTITGRATLIK